MGISSFPISLLYPSSILKWLYKLTDIVKYLPPVLKVGKLARAAYNVRVAGEDMDVCDLRGAPYGAVINRQTPDFHAMSCDA